MTPQQILLNIGTSAFWQGPPTGIVRTERELACRASARWGKRAQFVIWDPEQSGFCLIDRATGLALLEGRLAPAIGRNGLALTDYATGLISPGKDDLLVSLGFDWETPGSLRAMQKMKADAGFACVSVIYDLVPASRPHFSPAPYRDRVREYFWETMWLADRIICISEAVRVEVESFRAEHALPKIEISACLLGIDPVWLNPGEVERPTMLADHDYLLYVSTIEPRKNHAVLYEAWDEALRRGEIDGERCRLVFAGRPGWGMDDLLSQISVNPSTRDTVLLTGELPDVDLKALMIHAAAIVYPSHYEGFGLPVAEALALGKPVIASRIDALMEVGGTAAEYVEPGDGPGWRTAMARALQDPSWRETAAGRVKAARRPLSWDAVANLFCDRVTGA